MFDSLGMYVMAYSVYIVKFAARCHTYSDVDVNRFNDKTQHYVVMTVCNLPVPEVMDKLLKALLRKCLQFPY